MKINDHDVSVTETFVDQRRKKVMYAVRLNGVDYAWNMTAGALGYTINFDSEGYSTIDLPGTEKFRLGPNALEALIQTLVEIYNLEIGPVSGNLFPIEEDLESEREIFAEIASQSERLIERLVAGDEVRESDLEALLYRLRRYASED